MQAFINQLMVIFLKHQSHQSPSDESFSIEELLMEGRRKMILNWMEKQNQLPSGRKQSDLANFTDFDASILIKMMKRGVGNFSIENHTQGDILEQMNIHQDGDVVESDGEFPESGHNSDDSDGESGFYDAIERKTITFKKVSTTSNMSKSNYRNGLNERYNEILHQTTI